MNSLPHTLRPKKDPCDTHHGEGPRHAEEFATGWQPPPFANRFGSVTPVRATQQQRQEEAGVDTAPNDEGPVGAVPKSTHKEDDEDIADGLPFAHARTAQRDVEVVAEPG